MEQQTEQSLLAEALQKLLDTLEPRERRVIQLRYGLEDGQHLTLAKVGERLDLSRECVRQIESKAMRLLRKQKAALTDFR